MSRSSLSIATYSASGERSAVEITTSPTIGTQVFDLHEGEATTIVVGPGAGYRIYAVPRAERGDVLPG